ncbi:MULTISPECIES: hypothetical protein [Curtobacterium]|jgi:hypothetical protein|uniref:hypothetical protein n=1 Tax=Curtobacterium TaxID=2034 RepID=UPI001E60DEB1|nr:MULTISPECIES: hypothetical protein [Curtobacterium]MCE0459725.1 hypothetical protein [Curtobacterium allii]MCS6576406.1 hypothetical protein [Curtobacterium flaccumfaciens pv. flaccumfaciens]MDQ0540790.1 heme/copper-type cytochrome/quinol oxidase subunit 2 [Curtobacterium flaccumfaciens]
MTTIGEPFATWMTMVTWFLIVLSIGIIACLLVLVILRVRARSVKASDGTEGRDRRASVAQLIGGVLVMVVGLLNGIPMVLRESAPIDSAIGTPVSLILIVVALILLVERPRSR